MPRSDSKKKDKQEQLQQQQQQQKRRRTKGITKRKSTITTTKNHESRTKTKIIMCCKKCGEWQAIPITNLIEGQKGEEREEKLEQQQHKQKEKKKKKEQKGREEGEGGKEGEEGEGGEGGKEGEGATVEKERIGTASGGDMASLHKRNTSGLRGVHYCKRSNTWRAEWMEDNKKTTKSFSVRKYGELQAKTLALAKRKEMEQCLPQYKHYREPSASASSSSSSSSSSGV